MSGKRARQSSLHAFMSPSTKKEKDDGDPGPADDSPGKKIKSKRGKKFSNLEHQLTEPSWRLSTLREKVHILCIVLGSHFNKPSFRKLVDFLNAEDSGGKTIFPALKNIFACFNLCPVRKIRVVIVGQDPYHGLDQAMGLSFSVPRTTAVPPSLRNMYKELVDDPNVPSFKKAPKHGDLTEWGKQGVLMLNTVLTVEAHKAHSHRKKGWETITSAALLALNDQPAGIVFLLWGKPAQDVGKKVDTSKHHILKAPHPSPLSAFRGFMGCRHFSECNKLLEKAGKDPIDWAKL